MSRDRISASARIRSGYMSFVVGQHLNVIESRVPNTEKSRLQCKCWAEMEDITISSSQTSYGEPVYQSSEVIFEELNPDCSDPLRLEL